VRDFDAAAIAAIYRVIGARRDMRHFIPDPVEPEVLRRPPEAEGWDKRRDLDALVFENGWEARSP
jgi:hypothetical protein